ncbi:hypothetical protein BT93_D1556 [Corymbia citriodora subsp. variegata]|nr:hypothetical protein BT93_D1556 [Corymbia citriodora subsp. variegata]
MEICHFSHKHPLTLCTMEDAGEPCNGCSRPVFDLGYVCHDCGFLLHKKCAKLPQKVLHRLHPKHALTLLFISSGAFKCDVCKKTGSGFAFQCGECKYNVDVTCFLTNQPCTDVPRLECITRKPAGTVCHLTRQCRRNCTGCEQQILGPACCCKECDRLTLHKSCTQLARQREHPVDHSHSFTFSKEARCGDVCRKITGSYVYRCDKCSLDLDSACTCLTPSPKQEKHNDLPTCFEELQGLVSCNSCGTSCSNDLYRCISCNFNVHSTRSSFPSTFKHRYHAHSLTLEDSTPMEDSSGICCAACEKKISPNAEAYYCAECCYGVHPECVVHEDQTDQGKLLEDMARVRDEIDAVVTQLKPCPRQVRCTCH